MPPSLTDTPKKNDYLPLKSYVAQMYSFQTGSGWRLPLGFKDKLQLFLLSLVVKWSWFSDRLYIKDASVFGVGYDQLFNYIEKHLFELGLHRQKPGIEALSQHQWRLFIKSPDGTMLPLALGAHSQPETALSKAFGEGLERYFALWSKANTILTSYSGTYAETQKKGFDTCFPANYHGYTTAQLKKYPYFFQDVNVELEWVRGTNVCTKKVAYIPKQLVSKQCQKLLIPTEGMMYEFTTNGGAGWFTKTGAVTRGLFELIQRDAFLVTWLTQRQLPAVDISTITSLPIQTLLKGLSSDEIQVQILKADAIASVPTAIVVVTKKTATEEQVSVTAHCDVTFEQAVIGVLEEVGSFFGKKAAYDLPEGYQPFLTAGVGRLERMKLYQGEEMVHTAALLHSGKYIPYEAAKVGDFLTVGEEEVLAELSERLKALGEGYTPYYFEYTNQTLKDIGFTVVKCFVPQLFPIYLTEHLATIKSVRLHTAHCTEYTDALTLLNPQPHPFP